MRKTKNQFIFGTVVHDLRVGFGKQLPEVADAQTRNMYLAYIAGIVER